LLGLPISSTLSWEKQIVKMTSRMNAALHQLKICKHLLPFPLRTRLILTLIFPLMDYCCTVLTDITSTHNLRLQRALINTCIRFIFQVRWDKHITLYFERFHWLKIKPRRDYFMRCLLFSILNIVLKISSLFSGFMFREIISRNTRVPDDTLLHLILQKIF